MRNKGREGEMEEVRDKKIMTVRKERKENVRERKRQSRGKYKRKRNQKVSISDAHQVFTHYE